MCMLPIPSSGLECLKLWGGPERPSALYQDGCLSSSTTSLWKVILFSCHASSGLLLPLCGVHLVVGHWLHQPSLVLHYPPPVTERFPRLAAFPLHQPAKEEVNIMMSRVKCTCINPLPHPLFAAFPLHPGIAKERVVVSRVKCTCSNEEQKPLKKGPLHAASAQ